MNGSLTSPLRRISRFGWLTGPIFDKELRVSSRRRRNFVLRTVYILLLAVFVAVVWAAVVQLRGAGAFQQSRMASAGKEIVVTIVIFQFVATQLLAIVMLSNAVSDEIYHRTLGLLMTTPINGLQIVMGKLLSKLLQLVLLLGISLPMLAIVRVFGGVSWDYLVSSLCITLTAVLFAGSVSLLLSVRSRKAYVVILRAASVLVCLYFVLPALVSALLAYALPKLGIEIAGSMPSIQTLSIFLAHYNPVFGLSITTQRMLAPPGLPGYYWPIQCGLLLLMSVLVLARAVIVVRRAALQQALGQVPEVRKKSTKPRRTETTGSAHSASTERSGLRRVKGPPVVWKELRAPLIQGVDNKNSRIGLAAAILAMLLTYLAAAHEGNLDEDFTHTSYALLFMFIGLVMTVIFAATRITPEKESQSWTLLLTTPLSDWEILIGKAVGAVRRCTPIWGLLAGHVLFFVLIGYIHPIAIFHLAVVVAWVSCFLTGAGLYFSTRFARSTSAVVASFALAMGLWLVGPILIGLLSAVGGDRDPFEKYMWAHPAVQTELLMSGASGAQNAGRPLRALDYGSERVMFRVSRRSFGFGQMTTIVFAAAGVYVSAGLFFMGRAKRRLRRNVFQ
jgi:ABC-type transport system involved in multi-copper enzyme maturation permease subunit